MALTKPQKNLLSLAAKADHIEHLPTTNGKNYWLVINEKRSIWLNASVTSSLVKSGHLKSERVNIAVNKITLTDTGRAVAKSEEHEE